jgi:hypothetical protein
MASIPMPEPKSSRKSLRASGMRGFNFFVDVITVSKFKHLNGLDETVKTVPRFALGFKHRAKAAV